MRLTLADLRPWARPPRCPIADRSTRREGGLRPFLVPRGWRPVIGVLGMIVAGTVAPAASAQDWPPPATTPLVALSSPRYWPSDPDFAYTGVSPSEPAKPGQWWLYSFVPERAANAPLLRQAAVASGVSVDAAWRYTIGNSNVILAILDDGIDWTNRELRARIVLNPGELQQVQPNHADQSPCAPLVIGDPSSPRFDCALPPDGVVTAEDYAEKLGQTDPAAIVSLNRNNKDDDGNGLVDDIAGWDFIDSDPLPEHRNTRHGTESALDAIAQTGDANGRAGACPHCVGIPLRVSEQRGSDPQRLALAIVYAASRGATVALVGHLPVGRSETLEHAIKYAAQRGMLVLFPTDGEQQTVSLLKFDSDAWLPLSALTTRGDSELPTKTTSFVALDPCQAFPAGTLLAGAGPSCSRRAYSVALGVAGLVASAANLSKAPTKLSPLELAATLRSTSDPINIPDDDVPSLGSMRRINANSAVELVRNGLAPAELSVDRPYWHEALALERLKAPFEITGRLTSSRADSVDLSISAAEGRNPRDASFQALYTKKGWQSPSASIPNTLAAIDLRTWYATLHPDFDREPLIQSLVSLRIRVTSHFASAAGAQTAEAQVEREILLLKDPDLIGGAPVRMPSRPTAPKLVDVDGNGVKDIVFGTLDGRITALTTDGNRIKDITATPIYTHLIEEFDQLISKPLPASLLEGTPAIAERWGHSAIVAPPAIADLDGDGKNEIVVATLNGLLYAAHFDGTFLPGFNPVTLPEPKSTCVETANSTDCGVAFPRLSRGTSSSPVIADVNGDGQLDVVVAAHDGRVHAYDRAGKPLLGWPVLIPVGDSAQPGPLTKSPAIGDFDADSVSDLLVTAGEQHSRNFGRGLAAIVLGGRFPEPPRIADGWPVGVDTYDVEVDRLDRSTPGGAVDSSAAIARALIYGNSSQPFFVPVWPGATQESDPGTRAGQLPSAAEPVSSLDSQLGFDLTSFGTQSQFDSQSTFAPMLARPSLGDLDRDGQTDVVLPGIPLTTLDALRNNNNDSDRVAEVAFFSGTTGKMLPSAPIRLESLIGVTGATLADLTNDGYPEVILPNGAGAILAVDACGRSAPGWPKWVGGNVSGAAAVADIDGDERLEVVVTTEEGWVYAWKTNALASSYVPWGSELADAANTSSYRAVTENVTPSGVWPLQLDAVGQCSKLPAPPVPDLRLNHESSARGGCQCEMRTGPACPNHWGLMLFGAGLCLTRRMGRTRYGTLLVPKDGLEPSTPRL